MRSLCLLLALFPFVAGALGLPVHPDEAPADVVAAGRLHLSEGAVPGSFEMEGLAGKRAGMAFTRKGKAIVKQENADRNDGKNRCENCDEETVPGQKHQKGVTPPSNETQVDHKIPRAKGGPGDPENGQVLCRECNIEKSDKEQ